MLPRPPALIAAALLLSVMPGVAVEAEEDPPTQPADMKAWQQLYLDRARALVATETGDAETPLALQTRALLSYSNPVRPDVQHGGVFLWTRDDRPAVIAAIWSAYHPEDRMRRSLCYEFHSLSDRTVKVPVSKDVTWRTTEPGITWIRLPKAPKPAASRPLRLTQMRNLVADLSAAGKPDEAELRLLRQPLYRYPDRESAEILDGAIFAFVLGTDPELFLLIEARKEATAEDLTWHIAPARFSGTELSLRTGNTVLWSNPPWDVYSRESIYDFLYGIETLSAEPPVAPK